ncbi:hypothetical protein GCM10007897_39290 [Sphingobium jiangsuense]|nr:hypothetical protein GCM10007897_39290 [Sphingobium jiangsuense]
MPNGRAASVRSSDPRIVAAATRWRLRDRTGSPYAGLWRDHRARRPPWAAPHEARTRIREPLEKAAHNHHHYRASGAIRIIMNFRTSSISTALHPLRYLLQAKPRQASGTLSPQDLRRIVAEMVG